MSATDAVMNQASIRVSAGFSLIEAVFGEATRRSLNVAAVVVDAAGTVVASARMDGSQGIALPLALEKATMSAVTRARSGYWAEETTPNSDCWGMAWALQGRLSAVKGAVPIFLGSRHLGALGVSGAPVAVDEELATYAVGSIGLSCEPSDG